MESQLKIILQKKNCTFDKFMYKIEYIKSKDDIREHLYLTSVLSGKKVKFLFITREIIGSWFDSIKDIEDIMYFLEKHYSYTKKENTFIFHIFIESINFEHFYLVDLNKDNKLQKLSHDKLEKLLD